MPLRVAFDLDGVLADMEGELVAQTAVLFGEALSRRMVSGPIIAAAPTGPPQQEAAATPTSDSADLGAPVPPEPVESRPMTPRQERRLWRHIETIENFWESLKEIEPGSVVRLAAVAASRRWEIIFLTRRPPTSGATSQVQTQRWLEAHGFKLPSVYVVQGSRGRIAASLDLDFVIDDTPENCLDVVVDSRARAVLVWRDDQQQPPSAARRLGIGVVKSVDECLNILEQIDAPVARKPNVMNRVMRMLGLKAHA